MTYQLDGAGVRRLEDYFARIGGLLKDRRKRESFAMYALGLLGDGERKSVEPMAARAASDPAEAERLHFKLLHFVGQAQWSDEAVRREAARYVVDALAIREPVTTWIVDDTGFLKQGRHSAGVQRQYTGSAGKVTNCQIGVSLAVATSTEHAPIDFALYLPESWAQDPVRRKQAHVPDDVRFLTKTELALQMIERACLAGIPGEIILTDSSYGDCCQFRDTVRLLGFDYAVAVHKTTNVRRYDARGRLGPVQSIAQLVGRLGAGRFRKLTWREGTKGPMASRFYFCQVKPAHDDGIPTKSREAVWLIAEWPPEEESPTKFVLTTLPRRMSKREIVRILKERWRTERMYEDLKGELGLDHFEGRSFVGWHHHVSVAICCYAFLVAERVRAFPPDAAGLRTLGAFSRAA
jgi:SRSO17 transposase